MNSSACSTVICQPGGREQKHDKYNIIDMFYCRDGDIYAALRDCHSAIKHDSDHLKAHFRLSRYRCHVDANVLK